MYYTTGSAKFCGLADNTLETPWRRVKNANRRDQNAKRRDNRCNSA